MALRSVVKVGDDVLRKKSKTIECFDSKLHQILDDMAETMYHEDGCGLAAVQIGFLKRMFIVDIGEGLYEFVNPDIIVASGSQIDNEGCLSVSNRHGLVERPLEIKIAAFDRNGKPFSLSAKDYFARAICHEYDHLNGVLFIDKVIKE